MMGIATDGMMSEQQSWLTAGVACCHLISHHIAALDAEAGEGGGEADAAAPGLPPRPRRQVAGGGDEGGAVREDERGPLEEGDGRERRVVGGAEHGALHLPPTRRRRAATEAAAARWEAEAASRESGIRFGKNGADAGA